jgi:hypothetical protein
MTKKMAGGENAPGLLAGPDTSAEQIGQKFSRDKLSAT